MADIIRGRPPSQRNLPEKVAEFMLAHETGWSLEYIRSMNVQDRAAFNIISQFSYNAYMQSLGLKIK